MAAPRRLQLTLALLKPDAVAHPLVSEGVSSTSGWWSSWPGTGRGGPMWAYILAHENAVPLWRSLMGPTKVFRARHSDPDSIRGAYGLTDTRNTTHGSDSPASASREIAFFFPEFDERRWYEQDEPRLRRGQLFYSPEERVHRVLRAQEADVT
ncbi:nucleoside diphosphate kinase 6 isoform X3 [Parus major]|uniref:nucleoside diphosphate kinase 6 isoform X3 n=1 Tax=Parus major TaxID=9157 RepID=UPI0007711D26|nr:nucleoside diphosphate kinase 6 isoform X3 [Parus major]